MNFKLEFWPLEWMILSKSNGISRKIECFFSSNYHFCNKYVVKSVWKSQFSVYKIRNNFFPSRNLLSELFCICVCFQKQKQKLWFSPYKKSRLVFYQIIFAYLGTWFCSALFWNSIKSSIYFSLLHLDIKILWVFVCLICKQTLLTNSLFKTMSSNLKVHNLWCLIG